MSGIITKAHILAITMIFAAALLVSGLSLYRTLLVGVWGLQEKYENAMVVQSGNDVHDLTNKRYVTFPRVYTTLCTGDFIVDVVEIHYLSENDRSVYDDIKIYYDTESVLSVLLKQSGKHCKASYEIRGKKYYLILQEVDI